MIAKLLTKLVVKMAIS